MANSPYLTDQAVLGASPEVVGLERQRKLADLLTSQAFESPQGQMISGRYVKPAVTQQMQPLLSALLATNMNQNLDEKQTQLAEALRGTSSTEMNEYARLMKTNPDAAAEFARSAKTPEVRALGIKSLTPEEYTLSAGQTRYRGGQEVNRAAPEPKLHVVKGNLVNEQGKVVYTAPLTGEEKVNPQEAGLRSSFLNQAQPHIQMSQAYRKIESAPESPVGDVSRIFNYMKILDPSSTVREGEVATIQNARGIPESLQAKYNKALTGEGLSSKQRQELIQSSGDLVNSQKQQFETQKKYYSDISNQYRINPENIIYDPYKDLNVQTTPPKQGKPVANINQQLNIPTAKPKFLGFE